MENPAAEIKDVILTMCTKTRAEQQAAIANYFTPDAEFVHPLCRVPPYSGDVATHASNVLQRAARTPPARLLRLDNHSFQVRLESRRVIAAVYRWYRITSPHVEIDIESVAWDADRSTLFVALSERLGLWLLSPSSTRVRLVTEFTLRPIATDALQSYIDGAVPTTTRYYIARQEDHFQINELFKIFNIRLGAFLWYLVQLVVALLAAGGAVVLDTILGFLPGPKATKE